MSPSSSPMLSSSKLLAVSPSKSPSSHSQILPDHHHQRAQHIAIKEPNTTVQVYLICQPHQVFMMPPLKTPSKSALKSPSALTSKSLSVSPLKSPVVSPVVHYKLFPMSLRNVMSICCWCGHSSTETAVWQLRCGDDGETT
jgi:hypothetical protein